MPRVEGIWRGASTWFYTIGSFAIAPIDVILPAAGSERFIALFAVNSAAIIISKKTIICSVYGAYGRDGGVTENTCDRQLSH